MPIWRVIALKDRNSERRCFLIDGADPVSLRLLESCGSRAIEARDGCASLCDVPVATRNFFSPPAVLPAMRILGISGSLQGSSSNLTLLQTAARTAPAGVTLEIYAGLSQLPHFNPDLEKAGAAPGTVSELRSAVAAADALLIASPEYGHSLPGALKNAVDWLIGSGELEGKWVAITAAVPAAERGRRGLQALRDTLGAVSARIVGGEPIVRGPGFEADVARLVAALVQGVSAASP